MEVFFKKTFIKDFKNLPQNIQEKAREICLFVLPKIANFNELKNIFVKKITGFSGYYRIKIGDYRIGLKKENNKIIFMRVLHRKDIYRFFP